MNKQKFNVGDQVRVRHFDEIDTEDIGIIMYDAQNGYCYGLSDTTIDMHASSSEAPYVIKTVGTYMDSYVYRIGVSLDGPNDAYWWAQGMLCQFQFTEEELSDPDPEDLFAFLSSK